jgi:chemotaxis response regulator CheB
MATSTLQKITTRAKQLRTRDKGRKKWVSYVKEASRQIMKKSPRKKSAPRKSVAAAKRSPRKKVAGIGTVAQGIAALKRSIVAKIVDLEGKKFMASRVTDKRRYQKEINDLKAKYRRLH